MDTISPLHRSLVDTVFLHTTLVVADPEKFFDMILENGSYTAHTLVANDEYTDSELPSGNARGWVQYKDLRHTRHYFLVSWDRPEQRRLAFAGLVAMMICDGVFKVEYLQ